MKAVRPLGCFLQERRTTGLDRNMAQEKVKERPSGEATEFFYVVQQIRESLNWLRRMPERASKPYQKSERNVRDSIRQLSRQRVSDLLRQLRAAHGLSYEQVNQRTHLSQQLLFDVEFKDRRLSLDELRRLADCYQVSVNDLLGIDVD